MSFLNGIGLNSVVGQYGTSFELSNLREIQVNGALNGNANGAYGLTAAGKNGISLAEMQNEENTTFLFEYRAYLNSQLTTIVTKLTNALASDLDAVMMVQNPTYGSVRANMQGWTDNTKLDPGAARTAMDYLSSWRAGVTYSNPSGYPITQAPWLMSTSGPSDWRVKIDDGTFDQNGNPAGGTGTFAVITYGNNPIGQAGPNDTLFVDYDNLETNTYWQAGAARSAHQFNVTPPAGTAAGTYAPGNKFEEVLWKESRTAVFRNIIKADLLRDLVISSSTSLSTGSQLQASISLNARRSGGRPIVNGTGADNTNYPIKPTGTGAGFFDAAVDVFLTRFTCFYHS